MAYPGAYRMEGRGFGLAIFAFCVGLMLMLLEPRAGTFYFAGTLGAIVLGVIRFGGFPEEVFGLTLTSRSWMHALIGTLVGLILSTMGMAGAIDFKISPEWLLAETAGGKALPIWVTIAMAGEIGFAEELIFRGLIQRGMKYELADMYGGFGATVLGVLLGAVTFAIFHIPAYGGMEYIYWPLIAGILFGVLLEITDSLYTPIMAHFVYDSIILVSRKTGSLGSGIILTMIAAFVVIVVLAFAGIRAGATYTPTRRAEVLW